MDLTVFDYGIIGKSPEGLEVMRVGLAAAEAQRSHYMQGEQVAPMRLKRPEGPTMGFQHVDYAQVLGQAIAVNGVEKKNVAVYPEPTVKHQISCVSDGE